MGGALNQFFSDPSAVTIVSRRKGLGPSSAGAGEGDVDVQEKEMVEREGAVVARAWRKSWRTRVEVRQDSFFWGVVGLSLL